MPKTFPVLGLPVHLSHNYTNWLLEPRPKDQGVHVVTINAEMAMLAKKDPLVAQIIQEADLVIPDGAGVVIYLKMRGQQQQRCPGIELAQSLIEALANNGQSNLIAFYGGKPGVTEAAATQWRVKLPKVNIITAHGYLSSEEQETWKNTLKAQQPRLILVGLGVPRQEVWIRENRNLCPQAIWVGVGGSFDIWSGTKSRAPGWLRNNNLEWLYRLYQEPWRWRRMLVLPQFFITSLFYRR
ncbi:WecB/TagA/CpsF family glycosyltransferase [Crocosphaera sp.]|uniref:WecB/TagA/CpsF family glycosyltransferase n=1 Tax=Crocosphaera sp. TaxID=2729996 RepID=UPI00260A1B70|nr:WecB/TagA/CpsF family glycosyltransferase [Crocosphaera sp.]MDJ0581865.1 WecB/TagA/CpsF family glycosyltransferase [Crocosphaera sp.]